jgi:hypothetical protein
MEMPNEASIAGYVEFLIQPLCAASPVHFTGNHRELISQFASSLAGQSFAQIKAVVQRCIVSLARSSKAINFDSVLSLLTTQ